jgi:hypothetical protein
MQGDARYDVLAYAVLACSWLLVVLVVVAVAQRRLAPQLLGHDLDGGHDPGCAAGASRDPGLYGWASQGSCKDPVISSSMIGTRYRHMTEAMQARVVGVIAERLTVALVAMPQVCPKPGSGEEAAC